jgi:hypothetical protein
MTKASEALLCWCTGSALGGRWSDHAPTAYALGPEERPSTKPALPAVAAGQGADGWGRAV